MQFIDDVLAGRVVLPMLPEVVQRVLAQLRQGDASLRQIADELTLDPVLSARVLRLANSSFFAGRRSVASVGDAVHAIGSQSLETLVIACGAQAIFAQVPGVDLRQFWRLAAATASSARQVARRLGVDADAAFSAGLLQGVGHLILCQCHPDQAAAGFSGTRSLWGGALAERELALWGLHHAQVGALWADRLGMPADVVQAIGHALDPLAPSPGGQHTLGRVVQMACHVAGAIGTGHSAEQAARAVDAALVELLALAQYLDGDDFADDFAHLKGLSALA